MPQATEPVNAEPGSNQCPFVPKAPCCPARLTLLTYPEGTDYFTAKVRREYDLPKEGKSGSTGTSWRPGPGKREPESPAFALSSRLLSERERGASRALSPGGGSRAVCRSTPVLCGGKTYVG